VIMKGLKDHAADFFDVYLCITEET
jgi:hypothetical protein